MNNIYFENIKIENHSEQSDRLNIEGYICHFNKQNLNNEIVDKDSFNDFFEMYHEKKLTPVVNYNHDSNWVIGGVEDISVREDGLFMHAFLNKGVKINDEMIIPNILAGVISGFSTEGYIKDGYNGIIELDNGGYYVKSFLLTSVAVTATPADWDAKFSLANFINEYKQEKQNKIEEVEQQSKWYLL